MIKEVLTGQKITIHQKNGDTVFFGDHLSLESDPDEGHSVINKLTGDIVWVEDFDDEANRVISAETVQPEF